MGGSGVDLGELAAYRKFTSCEDGGGVMVSGDMEDSMVGMVADGALAMGMEADMAWTLSWLAGKAALGCLGVEGESSGLDMLSKELGEAIIVKENSISHTASFLSHLGIEVLSE